MARPCAFHWLQYLLGQPRLGENFSRGASSHGAHRTAELQASFSWPHANCQHNVRWIAASARAFQRTIRGSWARDGAQAEHRTCHWHGLAPVAAALPSAYRPLQAMTYRIRCLLYRYSRYSEAKIETKAKIVVPYHSRYSWELTQIVSSYITDARSTTRRGGGGSDDVYEKCIKVNNRGAGEVGEGPLDLEHVIGKVHWQLTPDIPSVARGREQFFQSNGINCCHW